jgi:light-independent protochlorophyllide reductase subunit N
MTLHRGARPHRAYERVLPHVFDQVTETIERDDFCSLAPIGWLHHKMQDSFFLVVGTHSCQGFLQTALGVMIFAKPRFATAILDEDDLSGRDALEAVQPLVEQIVAEHRPGAIFLASTCTPEILKMNIAGCAKPLEALTGVRIYPCRLDGFDPAYTQGEDHVLQSMIERCPVTDEQNLVVLGCLSALEEAEIRLECAEMGLPVPSFLPNESALDLPPIGPNTVLASTHPYLYGAVSYAQRERGCAIHKTIFPYGPDGARAFYETLAEAFGRTVSYADRERSAWAACERDVAVLRGRSVSFVSDTMLELPLARTLRAAGMTVQVVGTPNIYRKFHALESARLADVEVIERPDRFEMFARLAAGRPDLVVANLNVANALEGMGFNVKWATELTFQPISGFNGAPSLFGMFAASMRRHDALARTRRASNTAATPIDLSFFREPARA